MEDILGLFTAIITLIMEILGLISLISDRINEDEDVQSWIRRMKIAWITYILIALHFIVFFAVNLSLGDMYFQTWVMQGSSVLSNSEYIRLITFFFLEKDIFTFLGRMITLFFIGILIEIHYSKIEFLLLYFVFGILGGIFLLFFWPTETFWGSNFINWGLAGAIFISSARKKDIKAVGKLFIVMLMPIIEGLFSTRLVALLLILIIIPIGMLLGLILTQITNVRMKIALKEI